MPAEGHNVEFVNSISKFAEKSESRILLTRQYLCYELFSRVLNRTPVGITPDPHHGTLKFNWRVTRNNLPSGTLKGTDPTGKRTKDGVRNALERIKGDDTIYFSNNVVYVQVVENGGYPSPVVNGTWNPRTKKYEVRSSGGYSRLSPSGMVKVSIAEFPYLKDQAIQEAKRNVP